MSERAREEEPDASPGELSRAHVGLEGGGNRAPVALLNEKIITAELPREQSKQSTEGSKIWYARARARTDC